MAINRLMSDIMKISEIMDYNFNLLDMSIFGIETYVDGKADCNIPLEVVYNKQRDLEYKDVEMRIGKIYNAFMYGEQSKFWKPIIIESFEPKVQVDFMLLVSFIYMKEQNDNKESRIAETVATVAAILSKYIDVPAKKDEIAVGTSNNKNECITIGSSDPNFALV